MKTILLIPSYETLNFEILPVQNNIHPPKLSNFLLDGKL